MTTGGLLLWQEGRESEMSQCLFDSKSYVHWVKVVYRATGVFRSLPCDDWKSTVVAGGEGVREEPVPVLQQNLCTLGESCLQNHWCIYAAYNVTTGGLTLWHEGRESERIQCLFYNESYIHWVKVVYRTAGRVLSRNKILGGSLSITVNDSAQDMHIDLMHVLYVYGRVMGGGGVGGGNYKV